MTKYQIQGTKDTVELTQNHFLAKGGEGSIYVIGDTVYKVCEDGKMIPEKKLKELAVLDHSAIIKPEKILLKKDKPVGYTMRLVPDNARPLIQILTKAYRQRENVTPQNMADLVQQIGDGIRFIHQRPGYLQVDGHECNYMVTQKHDKVFFIDVNSFQTPNFPATAIMASIRDYHVPKDAKGVYLWSQLTDWYSFAIISFYMFTGIHPFKGRHPQFTNMKTMMTDQMLACKSVLDPETQYPLGAVYHPFEDVIPGGKDGAFMNWYRAVFIDNKRLPAPKDFQATLTLIAKVKQIVGSNKFDIREITDYTDAILGYYETLGSEIFVTAKSILAGRRSVPHPARRFRIGFTPKKNTPYVCWLDDGKVMLQNLQTGAPIQCMISGTDLMACEGRVYIQSMSDIFEIDFIEQPNALMASAKQATSIMPSATRLFQGVAVQDAFGTLLFSMFPESGHHRMVKIDELQGMQIMEAKYERNVLMVVASNNEGQATRFVFRFAKDWESYDVRKVENITPTGINFTVLPKGICICVDEEERIEIFINQMGKHIEVIDDPVIQADMRLCHNGDQARFARGSKFYTFAVKKA